MSLIGLYVLTMVTVLVLLNLMVFVLLNRHLINNKLDKMKRKKNIDKMLNQAVNTVKSYRDYYNS